MVDMNHEHTGHGHGHGTGTGTPSVPTTAQDWDEWYAGAPAIWSGNPNRHLVAEAEGLAAGRALDVGSGEGADAAWLAGRGWEVTAVDISEVALERAAAHAAEHGPDVAGRITWRQADITAWTPPADAFDLVSAQYMHLPPDARSRLVAGLAASVVPGGELLIVAHHPRDLEDGVPRPPIEEMFYTGDDLVAALPESGWTVLADEARRGEQTLEGVTYTTHDLVFRARRNP
ncbi:class I SAM-dependent methyltransferase [Nocardiopsis tropica]|uniref:class I SAM-dependent methyltransferase n=2 Tax=Nocardiopsis tropica TaxID=109330 RepID=UPI00337BF45E